MVSDSPTLFPIDNAERYLRSQRLAVERRESELVWPNEDGVSTLSVTPLQRQLSDGRRVSEMVTLTHTSPLLQELTPEVIAAFNRWATSSAFVPADAKGPTRLVSKVGIFSTDRKAAELVYSPLMCMEAAISGWHAAMMARGQLSCDPRESPVEGVDPLYSRSDFETLREHVRRVTCASACNDEGFTVEFPWDPGAVTHMARMESAREELRDEWGFSEEDIERMGGRTALLQIRKFAHPLYGSGLLSTLELPLPQDEQAGQLALELNAWELSGDDLPPLFGAWCVGQRAPAFMNFVPAQFCSPGLHINTLHWMKGRHDRVRQWLSTTEVPQ